jgi:hypothetical protein
MGTDPRRKRNRRPRWSSSLVALLVALVARPAWANTAVPVVMETFWLGALLVPLVILLESLVYRWQRIAKPLLWSLWLNLWSTVVGIGISLPLLPFQLETAWSSQSLWAKIARRYPRDFTPRIVHGVVTLALFLSLNFLLTLFVEWQVCRRFPLRDTAPPRFRTVVLANSLSYLLLLAWPIFYELAFLVRYLANDRQLP